MATVTLSNIEKRFAARGERTPKRPPSAESKSASFGLGPVNLTLPSGRTTVLLGPSGCGKSTLLKIVAGLVRPDGGQVFVGGEDVTRLPARDRRVGMVFQTFALYPNFTVEKNILAYFFFRGKTPKDEQARRIYQRTSDLMGVDIAHLLGRKPKGLSPGEQQRVALARCITRNPALFLLDEPFSNLDPNLRDKYRVNLKRLLSEFRITTLYVTHDQTEALLLADVVALMDVGKIAQVGSYRELYRLPRNLFVANFLNPEPLTPALNVLDGELVGGALSRGLGGKLVGVRPEDLSLEPGPEFSVEATVTERLDLPTKPVTLLSGRVGDAPFHAAIAHPDRVLPERLRFYFSSCHVFDRATGTTLESYE